MFESQGAGGIISFITGSSYLIGPGFVGVRELMRRSFDELWIIDLGGDNLGARKTPNVFAIKIPVAIAIGIRSSAQNKDKPAVVRYTKIDSDSRQGKLNILASLNGLEAFEWQTCATDWQAPFMPKGTGEYFSWPKFTDLFPYHTAGAVFYRSWPIAETKEVLASRWSKLCGSKPANRANLFKVSRDRKISYTVAQAELPGHGKGSIAAVDVAAPIPNMIRYGFRSFDRQYALYDFRLGDFLRPSLRRIAGSNQTFLVCPDTMVPGLGPLCTVSANLPDQHFFRGSFGGRDLTPLYRDAGGNTPNVTGGLLPLLEASYSSAVSVEDLAGYVYALLAGQTFTSRFWDELETPGPRVPLTKNGKSFAKAAKLGRKLIWLQTYGERFRASPDEDEIPKGKATTIKGVSTDPAAYPGDFEYDPKKGQLRVGEGTFGPVSQEVWDFEVSGLQVVFSWLGYRMKKRAGKKSSALDDIRPEKWSAAMSDELLELLWVIEATLDMEPSLKAILDEVVAGECFNEGELPTPKPEERVEPGKKTSAGGLLVGMGIVDDEGDDPLDLDDIDD